MIAPLFREEGFRRLVFSSSLNICCGRRKTNANKSAPAAGEELKHTERTVRKFFVVDGVYEGIVRIHGGWCDSIDE